MNGAIGLGGELNQYAGNYIHVAQANPAFALRLGELYGNGGILKASGDLQFDLGSAGNFRFAYQN
ncbi:MAG: hypothetical protein AAB601_03035, partial [Patescibacteria group bacterium]